MTDSGTNLALSAELADLRGRLAEAEETLSAIRGGEADALVIAGSAGDEVHLLGGGDRIYRQFIETIREGTATVSDGGVILSCSSSLAQTLRRPLGQLLGSAMRDHLSPDDHEAFAAVLVQDCPVSQRRKINLKTSEGALVPAYLLATQLHSAGAEPVCCLVFTDLEEVVSAEQQLRESEAKYRHLFDSMTDCFVQTGMSGEIVTVNPAFLAMLGYSEAEVLQLRYQDLTPERWHSFESEIVETQIQPRGYSDVYEKEYIRKDRTVFPVELRTFLLRGDDGRPAGMWAIVRDITERKETSDRILRLSQLYAALSKCNEASIRSADEQELFQAVCRDAVQFGGMKMAWIGLVDGPSQRVLPAASCGEGVEYLRDIRISVDACDPFGRGPTGTAIRENRPFWCQDFRQDPATTPWHEAGVRFGWAASAALPLTRNGNPVGSLTMYASVVEAFDGDTRRLLTEIAGNISFALDKFSAEAERRSAVDALRESEEQYRALFENSPDAVLLTVPDGRTLSANPAACRMFGWTAEELCALGRAGVVDTGDPRLAGLLEERARTGRTTGELTFLRKDGSAFQGEISSLLFRDQTGAARSSMIIRDVTERKRAETELHEAENRYRLLFDQSPDGIVIIDPATARLLEFNETAHRQLGYSREEFARLSISDIEAAETPEATRARVAGVIRHGRNDFETRHRTRQGEIRNIQVTAQFTEVLARPVYHCVWRDITEQLRLVEERARLEDQLRQAQKVEAIGRLAGGVAHDFNNLTAIVLGYGEMLLGQLRPDEPARKWVEQIVEAGKRSAALTRQLLAFSRRQVLLPVVLDLNGLLRNLEKMLARVIGEDIEMTFNLAEDLGRVTVDPGQLEQVVTNLVVNARDAMPQGGKLTVETANVELDDIFAGDHKGVVPGEYVRLGVTDTGCGMDKATLDRLFEPFFTTKEKGKGTGLGLSTVFGIVKQSGGYLYVASEPGQGTIFTIYLPRTHAEAKATAIESCGETPRGAGERVLLVEDEVSLRELCVNVLSRLGYQVSAAASGPEALLLVGEQGFEPDLVLADVVMPGMSGAEMARRLQKDRPGLKVLYMSGYPDDAIAPHGVLGPGISFLQKPFSEVVLAAKVCEVLGGAGGRKSAAPTVRRLLMIDDDEQFLDLVGHFCRKRGHVFAGADSAVAALAALAGQPFDVLLVDLNIPGTSGAAVLREIRAAGHTAPAIVLTGDVHSADMEALRPLGVVQVVQKSSDAEALLQAIDAA